MRRVRSAYRHVWLIVVLLLVIAAWLPMSQDVAREQAESGLKRALITYGVARGLNAVISVAQGTQFNLEPMGIGVTIASGQALAPLNDLVDQFSSLMLAASVAFGLQVLLIDIGAHWAVSLLLTVAAVAAATLVWRNARVPKWLGSTVLILALARFGAPACTLASDLAYRAFMSDRYNSAQSEIERMTVLLRPAAAPLNQAPPASTEPQTILDKAKALLPKLPDVRGITDQVEKAVEQTVRHVIDLIVVFVLQTVVVPLLFLWLMVAFGRAGARPSRE